MSFSRKRLAGVFKVLGNERRMNIISLLYKRKMSVIEVSKNLNLSFKSVSKHLQRMEREGLLKKKHEKRFMYYALTPEFRRSGVLKQIIKSK